MNLVKWIRKNERKIMAVVVVFLMVGFIGGSYISQLGSGGWGGKVTIATFGQNQKITNYDRAIAQRELEILRNLRADQLLHSQDLKGFFLAELLFSENRMSPEMVTALKRLISSRGLRISEEQIKGFYSQSLPTDMYWILLKAETKNAGIAIDTETVRGILSRIIPQLFNNATYAQVIEGITRRGYSQEMAESAFCDLLAILEYAQIACSNQILTDNQIRKFGKIESETIDVNLVKFDAPVFEDKQPEPGQEQIRVQFEMYKDTLAGDYSTENPYGFGYKLDDMVSLEYIAIKLDDISAIASKPTQQEMEDFYQANITQFTRQVQMDPNDPNSPTTEKIASFGQVAKLISDRLYQQRITEKTDTIINEAKQIIQDISLGADPNNLKEAAADYGKIASQLSDKYGIKIHSGTTGLLTSFEVRTDKYLGGLYLKSRSAGEIPVPLSQLIFSVDLLGGSTDLMDTAAPKLYESIGPIRDIAGKIATVVRVIEVKQAAVPDSIDKSINKASLVLDASDENKKKDLTVKELVIRDLKQLSAMDTAKQTAEEFTKIAQAQGWDTAIEQFNARYPAKDANEPNTFKIISLSDIKKASPEYLNALDFRGQSESFARLLKKQTLKENLFIQQLYSMIPADSNQPAELPIVMEIKPYLSYYLIKNLSTNRLYNEQYQSTKAALAYDADTIDTQNLAAVFFQPENIVKRMNLTFVEDSKQPKEVEGPPAGAEF